MPAGDFGIDLPLDMVLFYAIIEAAEKEQEISVSIRPLTITATVRTTGENAVRPIDLPFGADGGRRLGPGAPYRVRKFTTRMGTPTL